MSPASMRLWAHMRRSLASVVRFEDGTPAVDDLLVGVDIVTQGDRASGSVTFSLPSDAAHTPYDAIMQRSR